MGAAFRRTRKWTGPRKGRLPVRNDNGVGTTFLAKKNRHQQGLVSRLGVREAESRGGVDEVPLNGKAPTENRS